MEPVVASLKAGDRSADCARYRSDPHWTHEIWKPVMRVGVLTLSVLLAAWLVPGSGLLCLSEPIGHEVAAHAHSATPHSHAGAESDRGHTPGAPDPSHPSSTRDSSSHECDCCERASDLPALRVVLDAPQSRLELSVAAALLVVTAVETAHPSATAAQLRRLQPPALPFERTRRPLLI